MRIVQLRKSVRSLLLHAGRQRRRVSDLRERCETQSMETAAALRKLANSGANRGSAGTTSRLEAACLPLEKSTGMGVVSVPPSIDFAAAMKAFQEQDFETAIFILERLSKVGDYERLLLNICRCQTGRKVEAVLDLYQWRQRDGFPDVGLTLLALLLEAEGDYRTMERVLAESGSTEADLSESKLLRILNLQRRGLIQEARQLAREAGSSHRSTLQRLGLIEQTPADFDTVARLADELIENENMLRSVCIGVNYRGDRGEVMLLAHAIERGLPRLKNRVAGIEFLGELYLTAKRFRDARLWILRGIRDFPCSSELLELLMRLPEDSVALSATVRARITPSSVVRVRSTVDGAVAKNGGEVKVQSNPQTIRKATGRSARRVA